MLSLFDNIMEFGILYLFGVQYATFYLFDLYFDLALVCPVVICCNRHLIVYSEKMPNWLLIWKRAKLAVY